MDNLLRFFRENRRELLGDAIALYGSLFFFGYVVYKTLEVLAK